VGGNRMTKKWYTKGLTFGIIILLIGTCMTSTISGKLDGLDNIEEILEVPYTVYDSALLTFHTFDKKDEKQKEIVIPHEIANKLIDIFEELRYMITNEPGSDKTKTLKMEIIELLDMYDLIPEGLSKDYLLSLLNPSWFNDKQRTIKTKPLSQNFKNLVTRILGFFKNIQHFLKMRFGNTITLGFNKYITPPNPSKMTETATNCYVEGAGFGTTIPFSFFWLPRPRFFFHLEATDGGMSIYEINSYKSFSAKGAISELFLGFFGLLITITNLEYFLYLITGPALFTYVSADIIGYTNHIPIISDIKPPNNAIDVPISLSELSFRLTDVDGDLMDYTVNTNPFIGNGSGTNVGNGVYSVPVSGLERNTDYRWYLKVNEGNVFLEQQYTFKTES
jgi:hypothetical protein